MLVIGRSLDMANKGAYPTTGGWIKPIGRDSEKLPSLERYPSKTSSDWPAKIKKVAKK